MFGLIRYYDCVRRNTNALKFYAHQALFFEGKKHHSNKEYLDKYYEVNNFVLFAHVLKMLTVTNAQLGALHYRHFKKTMR